MPMQYRKISHMKLVLISHELLWQMKLNAYRIAYMIKICFDYCNASGYLLLTYIDSFSVCNTWHTTCIWLDMVPVSKVYTKHIWNIFLELCGRAMWCTIQSLTIWGAIGKSWGRTLHTNKEHVFAFKRKWWCCYIGENKFLWFRRTFKYLLDSSKYKYKPKLH